MRFCRNELLYLCRQVSKITKQDLIKIGITTLIGLLAFCLIIFWLKGHKFKNYGKFTFYFRNVNGLEEGNALRWNGLKIGVVESIKPVKKSFYQDSLPSKALIDLGKRHMAIAEKLLSSKHIEDLVIAHENVNKAQLEIALGRESIQQSYIQAGRHVEVTVIITIKNLPIGILNQVTIVPSGLIGQQYVDISTIEIDEDYREDTDYSLPRFVVLEPVRLDTLIRANVESAEAITNLTNRINVLFDDEDADRLRQLIDSAGNIAADEQFKHDLKQTATNLNEITTDFSIWKFIFPSGSDKSKGKKREERRKVKAKVMN